MEKITYTYEKPVLEAIKMEGEQGFANSTIPNQGYGESNEENW